MARRLPSFRTRVWLTPRAPVASSWSASSRVVAFGLAVLTAAWNRACAGNSCPSIAELGGYDPNQASKVYAADGRLITDLGLERRTVVPLAEMSPVRQGRVHHHRGQALLRAPRDRLVPRVRRDPEQPLQVAGGRRLLDHHDAAGAESLARGHQRPRQVAPAEARARPRSRARSRRSTPRTRSSSSTSTRSTSATARTASRPPPSATSASRSAT